MEGLGVRLLITVLLLTFCNSVMAAKPSKQPKPHPKSVPAATLTWQIPTQRADGSPISLAQLSAYEIYYTSDGGAASTVVISDPSITEYLLEGLAADTYYFSVAAIDQQGLKSELSNLAALTITSAGDWEVIAIPDQSSDPAPAEPSTDGTAAITLTWQAPVQRDNGDMLTLQQLSGYEVYYTTDSEEVVVTNIDDPAVLEQSYEALEPANYYFAVVALDDEGLRSEPSNLVAMTVDGSGAVLVSLSPESVSSPEPGVSSGSELPVSDSISLAWQAPTQRENGDPLLQSEIAGYEIIYTSEGDQNGSVSVTDPQALNYEFSGLSSDTYYFSIVAIDSNGGRSSLSNVVTFTKGM